MKRDIQDREDLLQLVTTFYQRLLEKEEFAHIFLQVAKIDIAEHLTVIVDFWEGVLFQTGTYRNNALKVHLKINHKYPLLEAHFNQWLTVFNNTVDDLFEGDISEKAKVRALSITTIIRMKISAMERKGE